ncbi:MAG: hypothetical protein ABUL48_01875 [Pseudorhodoplanes sp.]
MAAGLALAAAPAMAQPGTAACKRELAVVQTKMKQSLALVTTANSLGPKERCANYFKAQEIVGEIRGGVERCEPDDSHASALRNVDEVDDELGKTVNKHCPPSPGMFRINAIFIKRLPKNELPKAIAAAHTCETLPRAVFTNEPFENGRVMLVGCKGKENASADETTARNAAPKALAEEQVAIYLTRDSDGRGAKRLTLPILLADGREGTTDLIPAEASSPQSRDRLVGNWAPAKDGVCRIHAEWKVTAGKPSLVLWQELADCSRAGPPAFKTILDKR